jgi:translation initiation factor 2A
VFELGFSPLGTYVITWQRLTKDENGDAVKNLKVWSVQADSAGESGDDHSVVGRFVQKSQTGWNLQYTSDERFCARVVTNEVQFYKSDDLSTVWNKLHVEGVSDFALSPGKSNSIAVFVPERKVSQDRSDLDLPMLIGYTGSTGGRQGVCRSSIWQPSVTKDLFQRRQGAIEVEQLGYLSHCPRSNRCRQVRQELLRRDHSLPAECNGSV